jgi:hypothetical protein
VTAARIAVLTPWAEAMDRRRHQRVLNQFLNEYWAAFEDLVTAQRQRHLDVWFHFDTLRAAHRHFADAFAECDAPLRALRRVWGVAAARRGTGLLEPLTATDIDVALAQFARISDALTSLGATIGAVGAPALAAQRIDGRS